jgi:hypothetical protein
MIHKIVSQKNILCYFNTIPLFNIFFLLNALLNELEIQKAKGGRKG